MKILKWINRITSVGLILALANWYTLCEMVAIKKLLPLALLAFFAINIVPSICNNLYIRKGKLRICGNGCELLILFAISTAITVVYSVVGFLGEMPLPGIVQAPKLWILNSCIAFGVECIIFWNGILRVYTTSEQLGVRYRVLGILCGMIPIANLVALGIIITIVAKEVRQENDLLIRDEKRKDERICQTKYPILMVHGVFFRDFKYLNYWGRVPEELIKNGATVYYGNQQSAAAVSICGAELKERIEQVLKETGAEKVNIIAHSKGGLDSRYAISIEGAAPYVASLTTINTPHRGCEFADYLLHKIGAEQQNLVAAAYNATLKKLGDPDPDFLAAVTDLTASACAARNEIVKNVDGIFYQSVGSKLNVAKGGRFPLNFSYHLVNAFDGHNDGLVGENSFPWGERFQLLTVKGKRGISHGDMIDLNRENFDGFDVREFYIQVVADLKKRGL